MALGAGTGRESAGRMLAASPPQRADQTARITREIREYTLTHFPPHGARRAANAGLKVAILHFESVLLTFLPARHRVSG